MEFIGFCWNEAQTVLENTKLEHKRIFGKENQVMIRGIVTNEFEFSHQCAGKKYFSGIIKTSRKDRKEEDYIPIVVEEKLIKNINYSLKNQYVQICGEIRTYKRAENYKYKITKTYLYVYVKNIQICEQITMNIVKLKGKIIKKSYIQSCDGNEVVLLLLEVKRQNSNRADYLDCVTWAKNIYSYELNIGDEISILGKMQNRLYYRKYDNPKMDNIRCNIWIIEANKN